MEAQKEVQGTNDVTVIYALGWVHGMGDGGRIKLTFEFFIHRGTLRE